MTTARKLRPVTDSELLTQLNAHNTSDQLDEDEFDVAFREMREANRTPSAAPHGLKPVTDPELLRQLNEGARTYLVTSPDGRRFRVTGNGTKEEALAEVKRRYGEESSFDQFDEPNPFDQFDRHEVPRRSPGQELGRQLGLTARHGVEGLAALPNTFAAPASYLANRGLDAADWAAEKMGGNIDFRFVDPNYAISQALTDAGLPQPETRQEEVIGSLSRGVAGAGGGVGLARQIAAAPGQLTSQVGQTLAQQPAVQLVSGATGPAASETAKELGFGGLGQFVAGLGGSMSPSAASSGVPGVIRRSMRGGEQSRQRMQENIRTFSEAGTTPTLGQATERRSLQAAETGLANVPGSGGRMAQKAVAQGDDIAATIERRASELMRKTSGEQAGRMIERGVRGDGGFISRFKAEETKLYDKLDEFIPKSTRVDVTATRAALRELNADIEGAPAVSEFFKNSKIKGIESALKADTEGLSSIRANPEYADAFKSAKLSADDIGLLEGFLVDGKLPYEALKKLRTLVGREISDSTLASDVPRSKWKALYGALSSDMGAAATQAGPKAQQAWSRANTFTRAGHARIEAIESVVDKAGGPEAIFRAATANTKEGATTLRAVMQSLDDEGKKTVSATVLRRLGIANPSNQDDLGEQFSTNTFLTNWNKLSPEAKRTLFDRYGPKFREDMDQIAKVAANLRRGSEVFRNSSGTSRQQALWQTSGAFALSVLSGNWIAAAGIGGIVGGANLSARAMTNPRFVRWLAQATRHPTAHAPSLINNLAQQARDTGDGDLALIAAALEEQIRNDEQNNER